MRQYEESAIVSSQSIEVVSLIRDWPRIASLFTISEAVGLKLVNYKLLLTARTVARGLIVAILPFP